MGRAVQARLVSNAGPASFTTECVSKGGNYDN